MKIPRFVKEYAKYQKAAVKNNGLIKEEYKRVILDKIDDILSSCEDGFTTADEAIKSLNTVFNLEQ